MTLNRVVAFFDTSQIRPFIFSRSAQESDALRRNLLPIITQPAVARSRQNFLTRWAYIYHDGAHGWDPLSRPVPSRGRPSFPFNKSLQFFTLLHKKGPLARSCAFEGSRSPPLERENESGAPLLTDRRKGRSDFSRQTRVKLVPVYYGNAPRSLHGNDYDFSRDNSIITPDSLRSAENFRCFSSVKIGRLFTPCVNNC